MDQQETHHFLGKTIDGDRVWVSLRLTGRHEPGWLDDMDQMVTEPLEFAASGVVIEKGRRNWSRGGQCLDVMTEITAPAEGWTLAEVEELCSIWQKWHLNTMQAACAHMVLPASTSYDDRKDIVCSLGLSHGRKDRDGKSLTYKYGSAWLVRSLPMDVVERIEYFMAKPVVDLPEDR